MRNPKKMCFTVSMLATALQALAATTSNPPAHPAAHPAAHPPAHAAAHKPAQPPKPEPQYTIGPAPTWVVPMPDRSATADGAQQPAGAIRVLLRDYQVRIDNVKEGYFHLTLQLLNAAGVAELSQLQIPFDPQRDRLRIHNVSLFRGGEIIDELKSGRIEVLQREHGLEQQVLNGALTFHLLLSDVRVGDTIDYSYSIENSAPVWGNRYFFESTTRWKEPIDNERLRILRRVGAPLNFNNHDGAQPTDETASGWRTLQWIWRDVAPLHPDADTPSWYSRYPTIELSQFSSWHELAEAAVPLFQVAAAPSSELDTEIAKLRSAGSTDAERTLATVRFVQEEVRYTGIENGDSAYRPTEPALVLKRRFGDCKDKTLLAVALLRALGIDAAPLLVSSYWRQELPTRLPSPSSLDHAIVRVRIGNSVYWFDVTSTAQGGDLAHFAQADPGAGLLVAPGVDKPEIIPTPTTEHALMESVSTFDLRRGMDQEADLRVVTHFRGREADRLRRRLRTMSIDELGKWYLNYFKTRYPGVRSIEAPLVHDDFTANELTITESYAIDHLFAATDNGGRRFSLHTGLITDQLKAPDSPVRTMPLALSYPLDTAEQIEIRMPEEWTVKDETGHFNGPGFTYESHIHRTGADAYLEYHYRTLKDNVAPEEMTEFLKQRELARSDTYFSFTRTAPAAPTVAEIKRASDELKEAAKLAQVPGKLAKGDAMLTKLIGSSAFDGMSPEGQHVSLQLSGLIALQLSEFPRAQRLLMRSSSSSVADATDWKMRLLAANANRDAIDATRSLTGIAERWPEELHDVDDDLVAQTVRDTPSAGVARQALLRALFKGGYERTDGTDITDWWRDLALLHLAAGDLTGAVNELKRVRSVYALIGIRADNRFAPVRAEFTDALDIGAAAQRQIDRYRAAVAKDPAKLWPTLVLVDGLYDLQRFDEALGIVDSLIAKARGTEGAKLYTDYGDHFVWLLDLRARVLQALGRWDDAVAQLEEASHLQENKGPNVSQTINLAGLYNDLGRGREARDALARLGNASTSAYGGMQVATEQLNAAELLNDTATADRQLAYLRDHQNDSLRTYERVLISANRLDEAAALLQSRLNDPDKRLEALMDVQSYAATPRAPRAELLWQRWQDVVSRPDVQQSIHAVGAVETYPVRAADF